MFRSIKAKVFLLIFGILAAVALVLMIFSKRAIESKIRDMEARSIRSTIHLVKLNIEDHYQNLLAHKIYVLKEHRIRMKSMASMLASNLEQLRNMADEGLIKAEAARQSALDWVRNMDFSGGTYFVISNSAGTLLAHPDKNMIGRDFSHLEDVKSLPVLDPKAHPERRSGHWFANFSWSGASSLRQFRNMGCFLYHRPWRWIIGTVVDMDDLVAQIDAKHKLLVETVKQNIEEVHVAQKGSLFIFSADRELIIHPSLSKKIVRERKNLLTGNLLLDDLEAASRDPDTPLETLLAAPSKGRPPTLCESYVAHYKTLNWYIASCTPQSELSMPARRVVFQQMMLIGGVFVLSIAIAYLMVRNISKPLKKLTECAKNLPRYDFDGSPCAFQEIRGFPAKHKDEVGRLSEAFLFMEDALRRYIRDLQTTTAAKEKIESELRIAHNIQMSLLPKRFPPFPERTDVDVHAVLNPAREVGGDFYDFFFIDNRRLFFVIGDVSGKGVPASLFMAVAKTLFKGSADQGIAPDEILGRVNRKLSEDNETCMFVTVFCGILDTWTGELLYANGGHNPPMIIHTEEGIRTFGIHRNMALGVEGNFHYQMERWTLQSGDTLFLYTDGVTEAMNAQNEPFSENRLKLELSSLQFRDCRQILERLAERIQLFTRQPQQMDDIAMMAIRFLGNGRRLED